ncbi:MAG: FecR family protein [Daejeonella sp.]
MNRQAAKKLFEKYNSGTASQEEQIQLEQWYHKEQAGQTLSEEEANFIFLKDEIWQGTLSRSGLSKPLKRSFKLWLQITAAALILIALSFGLYFYSGYDRPTQYVIHNTRQDIAPGGNKAILTLADGRKISLTDATNGELAQQSGIRITKAADGQLIYTISDPPAGRSGLRPQTSDLEYNTIETPRGGQYQVILPDGTKVWLNAASSLKYPASFASLKERKVELNGEAYFEVAKDKRHPFVVNTDKQVVEVLGTHFNINTYADEPAVKTTLLEGSVKVSQLTAHNSQLLNPGQQSVLTANGISVSEANTEEAMAWKNGYFRFDDEKLESIMRKIARWYDVDVSYQDDALKNELFAAITTRFANVSGLLKMMEQTGDVKFNIEEKKIIISKKR